MNLLNKKSLYISIPKSEKILLKDISTKIILKKHNEPDIDLDIYKVISRYKCYIDKVNKNKWTKTKSYTNLFEIISYNSYCKQEKPLTLYEPFGYH